ncbi:MAG: hypothetical protein WC992_07010 [Acholeplasmataceae bacterium]
MTAVQVAEWEAYNRLEPIGEYRRDYMEGQILAMIQNIAQTVYGKKGKKSTTQPEDFIPWNKGLLPRVDKNKVQSPDDIKAMFMDLKKNMRQLRGTKEPIRKPRDTKE